MKTGILVGIALIGLSACQQQVPDSGAGVGFGDYNEYEAARLNRDAQLAGREGPAVAVALPEQTEVIPTGELAAAGIGGVTTPTSPAPDQAGNIEGGAGRIEASPSNPAPVQIDNPNISDEQNFDAVAGRETIESDALRRQQQAELYTVIEPTAVPTRTGGGPNIVQYALNTTNAVGEQQYSRFGLGGQRRFQRNCAEYPSADVAQTDFLTRGGPERDPRGLDPDGDGFACAWDPVRFRQAVGN